MHKGSNIAKIVSTAVVLTVLFAFSAMISIWWMGSHVGSQHSCVAATLQDVACPDQMSVASLIMHLNPFRGVLAAAVSVATLLLLAVLFRVLPFVGASVVGHAAANSWKLFARSRVLPPVNRPLKHWLARLEHSPSFGSGRV